MLTGRDVPVCGLPPPPDMALLLPGPALLLLQAAVIGGAVAAARAGLLDGRRARFLAGGLTVLLIVLVSPLCSVAVALFSARSVQHMLVVLAAAPLLALALPGRRGAPPVAAALVFAMVFWFWHLPRPYAATFAPDGAAWALMHLSLLAAATLFWASLRRGLDAAPVAALLALVATGMQMTILGALLTFASRPIYAAHGPDATMPWGLTPLEDQQLGGLLMWVPGGLVLTAMVLVGAWLRLPHLRALPALLLLLPVPALAQGNDAATAAARPTPGTVAPVGPLTTTEVTNRDSGPAAAPPQAPEGADRRTRILFPVCHGLRDAALTECRDKSAGGVGP